MEITSMAQEHTLLVVDDEPDVVDSLHALLRRDYRVLGTTRAREALSLLAEQDVHVIMTDQRMPEMTGVDLLEQVREAHPQIIRLLFTGYADIEAVINAINQGNVFRYINKPWTTNELKSVLRQATDHYDLLEERNRLLHELAQERDRQRLLLDVNNAVAAHLDLPALFNAIAACLRQTLQHEHASLTLAEPDGETLRVCASGLAGGTESPPVGMTFPIATSPPGQAFSARKPVLLRAGELGQSQSEFIRCLVAGRIKSLCCVPLVSPSRVLGTLNVGSRREGAFIQADVDLVRQVAHPIAAAVANALAYQEIAELKNQLAGEKQYLEEEIRSEYHSEQIVGASPLLQKVLREVAIVAPTDSAVLIQGETGTGKELIARAVHEQSGRRERTFVKVNCAATNLESELFGHEVGAVPGAVSQRLGRFELAHRGTLFLDEVGDIPFDLQPKLLRVLQEKEFERLGSTHTVRVDVRLVACTNHDLAKMVADRQFRSDLYYRLNVFPLSVPPLRDRREDIPMLLRYFTERSARRLGKRIESIPAEALTALCQYSWPGNIRELENFIERAVILSPGTTLQIPAAESPGGRSPALTRA
jgi:formate hydrogenlyase transcriptional activator